MTTPEARTAFELNALIDGELTPDAAGEVEAWLASDQAARGLAGELRDLNRKLQDTFPLRTDEPLSPQLAALLERVPEPRTSTMVSRRTALAASLALLLLSGLAGLYVGSRFQPEQRRALALVAQAVGAHSVYVPEVRHPVEVAAAEERHLVAWLSKRLGEQIRAPDLVPLGFKLVGGRLLPDGPRPAALFMYETSRGQRLTLYVRRETSLANTAFQFSDTKGLQTFYWIDRPLAYAIVSNVGRAELTRVARSVYDQLEKR
ncbi:MAG: anti-sigma factor [Hyphomicrobiaceae bacterium]|nr:anti-sigma factor [Hyphomicrobiaceae bacterium]